MSTIAFATLAINARLLGPDPFGAHALAMTIIAFGELLVAGPLAEALVQRRDITDAERRAGFWIAAPIGVVLLIAVATTASLFSGTLAAILPVTAIALPLAAFASAPVALLMRDLRFKELTIVELIATGAGSVVGVALALGHYGVWSLVFMELTRVTLRCAGVFIATRYAPGAPPPWTAIRSVLDFGMKGLGIAALAQLDRQIPRLVIGVWLGVSALGVFSIAMRVFETLSRLVLGPLSAVALSVASSLQRDMSGLRRIVLGATAVSASLAAPCFLGLAALAPLLVPLVFGASWASAILPMQILMLIGLRGTVSAFTVPILRGLGNSRGPLVLTGVGTLLTAGLTALAAPFGLVAITLSMLLRSLATWPIGARLVRQATGLSMLEQARAGAAPIAAAGVMAALVAALAASVGSLQPWIEVAALVAIGAFAYPAVLYLLAPASLRSGLVSRLSNLLSKRGAQAAERA
jgi:O-antigen/teichoic acid export membrane protein